VDEEEFVGCAPLNRLPFFVGVSKKYVAIHRKVALFNSAGSSEPDAVWIFFTDAAYLKQKMGAHKAPILF
jgi:hypothetical protein